MVSADHSLRRREFVVFGAAGAAALSVPGVASAKRRKRRAKPKAAKLPPRMSPVRRRTLGGLMDLQIAGLTAAARTHAVNRVEYVYRRANAAERIRVDTLLDTIESGAGGFWTKSLGARRAFVSSQQPPTGPVADFSVVQGFRRFVELQGVAVAAEAAAAGLSAGALDPSQADAPDVTPPGDATGVYTAQAASATAILQSAVADGVALARTAFADDDPEDDA